MLSVRTALFAALPLLALGCSTVSRTPLARPNGQRPVCEESGAAYGVAAGLFLGGLVLGAASDKGEDEECTQYCWDFPTGGEILGASMVIAALPVLITAVASSSAESTCQETLARDYPVGPMPGAPQPPAIAPPGPGPRGEIRG